MKLEVYYKPNIYMEKVFVPAKWKERDALVKSKRRKRRTIMYNCTRKTGHNEVRNRINSIGCHVIKAACRNLINDVIINN